MSWLQNVDIAIRRHTARVVRIVLPKSTSTMIMRKNVNFVVQPPTVAGAHIVRLKGIGMVRVVTSVDGVAAHLMVAVARTVQPRCTKNSQGWSVAVDIFECG